MTESAGENEVARENCIRLLRAAAAQLATLARERDALIAERDNYRAAAEIAAEQCSEALDQTEEAARQLTASREEVKRLREALAEVEEFLDDRVDVSHHWPAMLDYKMRLLRTVRSALNDMQPEGRAALRDADSSTRGE